jgi:hypothetical protein
VLAPDQPVAFKRLDGVRVVADSSDIDALVAALPVTITVLRMAPDDALVIGVGGVTMNDPHAIVEPEVGYAGAWVELEAVRRHVEWAFPPARPALAQGNVAGVPAKIWLPADTEPPGLVLLITAAAYADDLAARLR